MGVIATAQFTIRDANDITVSSTAPTSPTVDMVWLDTSQTPNVLKRWNGVSWEAISDDELSAAITAIANGESNLILNTLNPALEPEDLAIQTVNGMGLAAYPSLTSRYTYYVDGVEHGVGMQLIATNCRVNVAFGSLNASESNLLGLTPGETYTLSADVRYKVLSNLVGGSVTSTFNMYAALLSDYGTLAMNHNVTAYASDYVSFDSVRSAEYGVEKSARMEFTFTVPSTAESLRLEVICSRQANGSYGVGDFIELNNLKLEKGSIATAWNAAQEVVSGITSVQNATVSAQDAADSAATDAATAMTNAATAQSAANTAITNAAAAQSTADTAITNAATAQNKANSAYDLAEAIHDGTTGIAFSNSTVGSVTIDTANGLKIVGTDNSYFQVMNNAMGFFQSNGTAMLYYDNGNLVLESGAHIGGSNGWTIGSGSMYSGTASTLDASGGIYMGTDGISITSGSAHFMTSDFNVNITDGNSSLLMDTEGATISNLTVTGSFIAPGVVNAYNGPSNLYVNSAYSSRYSNYFDTLQAAINTLNGKMLLYPVTITIQQNTSEYVTIENITGIGGAYGGAYIYIRHSSSSYHLTGSVVVACLATVIFQYFHITAMNKTYAIYIDGCPCAVIANSNINGYGNITNVSPATVGIGVFDGANVCVNDTEILNAYYAIWASEITTLDCTNITGGACTYFIYGDGSKITWTGTRPATALETSSGTNSNPYLLGGACLIASAKSVNGVIQLSTGNFNYTTPDPNYTKTTDYTPPATPDAGEDDAEASTAMVVTLDATLTKTYSGSSWWSDNNNLAQGYYGSSSYRNYGVMWFDFSGLYGKTIDSASLTLKRLSNIGRSGSVGVDVCLTTLTAASGNPSSNITGSSTSLGSIASNETTTFSTSGLASIIQTIADARANYGIMLYTDGTNDGSLVTNKSFSTRYSQFAGYDDSAYAPTLTVFYHTSNS